MRSTLAAEDSPDRSGRRHAGVGGTAVLRCADAGHAEGASCARDQIAKASSSNATASRLLTGSSTVSS
jgi:hypothetical protein